MNLLIFNALSWEQRKVGDITIESTEYTTLDAGYPLLTSSRAGLMYQNEYRGNLTTDSKETLFSVVPIGACTYRHMSDDDVFHLNINTLEKGLVSREYPVFFATKENCLNFIIQYINSSASFRAFCAGQKKGGTRTRLYYNALCEFKMMVPSKREQEVIAGYLLSFDHLITLHQRKQLFDTRLKESIFTVSWEQRKLGELYKKSSEKNDGTIGMDKNITVATMQYKEDVKVSSEEYLRTYYTFNVGDIAFEGHQSKEFRFGRFVENDIGDGIVSHIFAVFRPIVDYDLKFWKYAINNESLMQRVLSRSTKASTMMHDLVTDDFLKQTFYVPSVEEQKQIGEFLAGIDNLITLHQSKLERIQMRNYRSILYGSF